MAYATGRRIWNTDESGAAPALRYILLSLLGYCSEDGIRHKANDESREHDAKQVSSSHRKSKTQSLWQS